MSRSAGREPCRPRARKIVCRRRPRRDCRPSRGAATLDDLVRITHQSGDDKSDHRGEGKPDRQEKLEHARALAAGPGIKTFGEVHRNHHADKPRGRALKGAADGEQKEVSSVEEPGQADDRNRDEEEEGRGDDDRLASEDLGERSREEGAEDRTPEHRADDEAELTRSIIRGIADVLERCGDHADVDAVDKSTQACHDEQIFRIAIDRHFSFLP